MPNLFILKVKNELQNQKELIWIFPRGGCGGEGIGVEEERPGPNFKTRKWREMKGLEKMF